MWQIVSGNGNNQRAVQILSRRGDYATVATEPIDQAALLKAAGRLHGAADEMIAAAGVVEPERSALIKFVRDAAVFSKDEHIREAAQALLKGKLS
jgi:hypothetical protein